jgi:hypothetical protein
MFNFKNTSTEQEMSLKAITDATAQDLKKMTVEESIATIEAHRQKKEKERADKP